MSLGSIPTHGWPQCATDGCLRPAYTITHRPGLIVAQGADHCARHRPGRHQVALSLHMCDLDEEVAG